jgi:hypothetical protein
LFQLLLLVLRFGLANYKRGDKDGMDSLGQKSVDAKLFPNCLLLREAGNFVIPLFFDAFTLVFAR